MYAMVRNMARIHLENLYHNSIPKRPLTGVASDMIEPSGLTFPLIDSVHETEHIRTETKRFRPMLCFFESDQGLMKE